MEIPQVEPNGQRAETASLAQRRKPKETNAIMQTLSQAVPPTLGLPALFAGARRSLGFFDRDAPGFNGPTRTYRKEAAVVGKIRLTDVFPAPSGEQMRGLDIQSTKRTAGATQTMNHVLMAESRVIQAGARLIPIDDTATPVQNTSEVAWTTRPTRFEVVTAAAFAIVADGADAAVSALPIVGAEINLGDTASHAISFTLSRREQKNRSDADLEFIVARALALGLARLCDAVLLGEIVANAPSTFTLAKAAAQGLRFGELRAMCGRDAQGAAVGADGVLRVAGVSADMTDVVEASVIGAFGRAAVAVEDEIRIVIKRMSVQGDMEVTVFVTAEPLIPTADFWVAA